jgi:hypothetical protein
MRENKHCFDEEGLAGLQKRDFFDGPIKSFEHLNSESAKGKYNLGLKFRILTHFF